MLLEPALKDSVTRRTLNATIVTNSATTNLIVGQKGVIKRANTHPEELTITRTVIIKIIVAEEMATNAIRTTIGTTMIPIKLKQTQHLPTLRHGLLSKKLTKMTLPSTCLLPVLHSQQITSLISPKSKPNFMTLKPQATCLLFETSLSAIMPFPLILSLQLTSIYSML